MPSLQSLPGCVTAVLGEQLSLSSSSWDKLPSHSWHSFPVTCLLLQGIALEIPSTRYNGKGNGEFCFPHLQFAVADILGWVTFYGLILFLKTSSTSSVCLVWVLAFQMEVGTLADKCTCRPGTWGRGCVPVAALVIPGCGPEPLALLHPFSQPGCALWAWAVSTLLLRAINTFLALGSGTKVSEVLVQKLFLLDEVFEILI